MRVGDTAQNNERDGGGNTGGTKGGCCVATVVALKACVVVATVAALEAGVGQVGCVAVTLQLWGSWGLKRSSRRF